MDFVAVISSLLGNFGVNWVGFLGQLATFVILLVGLRIILYKPVLAMLDERKRRIAQGLKDAEEAAKAKQQSEEEAAERLKEAMSKAEALLDEAQKSSKRLRDQLMVQTQAEIDKSKREQEEQLAQMKQDMIKEVKAEVADLVVATTKKVLGNQLSTADQKELAAKAAKEVG